jgi:crotonobetainyl-CoA:carnitine CoA-transferase CaiB-like acyl-CoA transferase
MGRWPVKEVTGTLSRTPGYVGGFLDRHGPNYGEDTEYVLAKILGMDNDQIEALRPEGIV